MDDKDFDVSIDPRGGMGRGARWEWVIYDNADQSIAASGEVNGAQGKANTAAQAALRDLRLDRGR